MRGKQKPAVSERGPGDNAPQLEKWQVPDCGVSRFLLKGLRGNRSADDCTVEAIADEIGRHIGAPKDAATDLTAVLAAVTPSNRLLNQAYRHAFHPDFNATIREAMACPAATRKRQLEAALSPVIGAAQRALQRLDARGPRKPSKNPATKDFKRFVRREAHHRCFAVEYGQRAPSADALLGGMGPEHAQAVSALSIRELERRITTSEQSLDRLRAALALLKGSAADDLPPAP